MGHCLTEWNVFFICCMYWFTSYRSLCNIVDQGTFTRIIVRHELKLLRKGESLGTRLHDCVHTFSNDKNQTQLLLLFLYKHMHVHITM